MHEAWKRGLPPLAAAAIVGCAGGSDDGAIRDLEDRVDTLEQRVDDIEAALPTGTTGPTGTTLTAAFDALEARVASLEASLAAMQAALTGLDTDVADLQSQSGTILTTVTDLSDELASIRSATATETALAVTSISGLDNTTLYNMGSLTVDVPASGRIIAFLSGEAVFFSDGRTVDVGIGDTANAFDTTQTMGQLDGTNTQRFYGDFSVVAEYAVSPGPFELFALAQGNTVFDAGSVNVVPNSLTAIFVPDAM